MARPSSLLHPTMLLCWVALDAPRGDAGPADVYGLNGTVAYTLFAENFPGPDSHLGAVEVISLPRPALTTQCSFIWINAAATHYPMKERAACDKLT
jgi:hypothetical protein